MPSILPFLDQWGLNNSAGKILLTFLGVLIFLGVLYKIGIIAVLLRLFSRLAQAAILSGFTAWRRTLYWLPWPVLALLLVGITFVSLVQGPAEALRELLGGIVLLFIGVVSCLA